MNERIRLLAEQAGMVKILTQHAHEYGAGTFEDTEYPELEKFAELIVKECADLFHLTFTDEQYQRRIDNTIKKHFGVEE
jgi:hypothetical protein